VLGKITDNKINAGLPQTANGRKSPANQAFFGIFTPEKAFSFVSKIAS
jgi:hypothetical protein